MTQWRISEHARDRMSDRAISALELLALLTNPSLRKPGPKLDGLVLYSGHGILAWVNESDRTVVTVGIEGAGCSDWEQMAVTRSPVSPEMLAGMLPLNSLLLPDEAPARGRRSPQRPSGRNGAVRTTSVLDDLAPSLHRTAERLVDGDFRRLRVLSRTRFEVLPAR